MQLKNLPNLVAKREKTKSEARIQALRSAQKHMINILAEDASRFYTAEISSPETMLAQLSARVNAQAIKIAKKAAKK